ncbi:MAG: RNA 2',3'-cyclic phosphodiesterase [Erythrobacter sp.]|nr:MAG: RNA 2',3'-cyclic phosphodiesterase [Erythrobacter sp.]
MPCHRLFVALPLPEAVRDALLDVQEGISGARWQEADNLHLTLRFVGEVDRHQFDDLATALESVPFRPFTLAISGVGHFERKGHGKAVWAGLTRSSALADLQYSVEMACRRAGVPAETRKFVPHVTLARLNSGSGPIGDWLAAHGDLAAGPWLVEGFSLWESNLTPNGALYSRLLDFPQGAPIDQPL